MENGGPTVLRRRRLRFGEGNGRKSAEDVMKLRCSSGGGVEHVSGVCGGGSRRFLFRVLNVGAITSKASMRSSKKWPPPPVHPVVCMV